MTKAFLPLLKNNFKIMFGLSKDFKQRRKDIITYVLLAVLLAPIVIIGCIGMYFMAQKMNLSTLGNFIGSIMFMSEIVVLFFGVQSAISVLFFAKDTEFLMALPATGLDIFLSKIVTIYVLHLGLALLIQVPIIITAGIGANVLLMNYYVLGILGSFLTPFIPLFLITIIAIPLGYLISYFKHNSIIGTIFALLIFGGVFAGYYYMIFVLQSALQGGNVDIVKVEVVMEIMSYIIYPNTYLATSMVTNGVSALTNFAIFFAIIVGLAIISIGLSAFLYKGSSRRGLESGSSKNGKVKDNEVKSVSESLLVRDIKNCLGDTSSAINYLMGLVVMPIIMVMMSIIYGKDSPGGIAPMVCVSASLAFIFGCGMNYFAIVSFSREGKQIDVLKMLPISSKKIVNQKIMFAFIYTLIIDSILMASMFIAQVPYMIVIMIFISVLFAGNGINIMVIYYDLKSPYFVWSTTKEMFKKNSKTLISMVMALPLMLIAIVSIICFLTIWPNLLGDNTVMNYFLAMVPALIVSIGYFAVAMLVFYPKLTKLYECLEI